MSPLMVACRMGVSCLDSIQLLLAHGAEPNGPKSVIKLLILIIINNGVASVFTDQKPLLSAMYVLCLL